MRKPIELVVNTWRLGGWVAKASAICLVVSPLCMYSTLALSALGFLSYKVPVTIAMVGHFNSLVLVPTLVVWCNGGGSFFAALVGRLRQLRPRWTRSSDAA